MTTLYHISQAFHSVHVFGYCKQWNTGSGEGGGQRPGNELVVLTLIEH